MITSPLFFAILIAFSVLLFFVGAWRLATRPHDPVETRMEQFGLLEEMKEGAKKGASSRRRAWPGTSRLLYGLGLGPWLAGLLARAAVPLTVAEFFLIMLALGMLGFVGGMLGMGWPLGVVLGAFGMFIPILIVRSRAQRRRREITWQLPDALTLLVGALRAGHGLSQALELLVTNLQPPASTEFAKVVRAVALGMPTNEALNEMAQRIGSDDIALVVTAINVQSEMGGNLAQTLETISDTVRERIHLFRHVRVLTAQQRLSGTILTIMPIALAGWLYMTNRAYIMKLFEPGWVRILPIAAIVLQVIGYLVIRKIMDIEV